MMKSKKTVLDTEKVVKDFIAAVEMRRDFFRGSDAFTIGYLEGFLKTNASQELLEAMQRRIPDLIKDAA